ncbi:MAG: hypothetical protein WCI74_17985, partial [Actinomycetes bacterium]
MSRASGFLCRRRIVELGVLLALAVAVMALTAGTAFAAVTYVGVGSATGVWAEGAVSPGPVSISMPAPSGSVGDVLICQVNFRGGTDGTIPATFTGWTLLDRTDSTTADGQVVYYRIATATTEGPYTWTYTNSSGSRSRAAGNIIRYSGVDTSTPPAVTGNSGTTSLASANGLTTSAANTKILAFFGNYNTTAIGTSTGMTSRYAFTGATNGPSIRSFDETIAVSGTSTLPRTATCGTGGWVAHMVALKPKSTNVTVTATGVNRIYDGTTAASVVVTSSSFGPGDNATATYT